MPNIFASEPGVLTIASIGVSSGDIVATLGANSPLFSLRWGNADNFLVLDRVDVAITVSGVITTSVATTLEMLIARVFTASDTGGAGITLTTDNNKFKTSFSTSLITDARIATTGTLTAGTRTLDIQPVNLIPFVTGTAIGKPLDVTTIYKRTDLFPIVFTQDEGFIIRNKAAGPATGTFVLHVFVRWLETVKQIFV